MLKENLLLQAWRSDPWKCTYGPVIILSIQNGDNDFKYESYTIDKFYKQCFFNLKKHWGDINKQKKKESKK